MKKGGVSAGGKRLGDHLPKQSLGAEGHTMSKDLDQVLEELQNAERVEPPAQFRESARIQDEALYDEAERDPEGFWAARAEELHWFQPWRQVLDESDAPFYKWFIGGKLNASVN